MVQSLPGLQGEWRSYLNLGIRCRVNNTHSSSETEGGEGLCSLTTTNSVMLTSDSLKRPPNRSRYFFISREHPDQTRTGFGSESLLLRGCTIRNTEVAIGIVIYAGHWLMLCLPHNLRPLSPLNPLSVSGNPQQFWGVQETSHFSAKQSEARITAAYLVHKTCT